MGAGLNHVSVRVDDLDESVRFYREAFGLEPIVAPSFDAPVAWLRAGELQVHLYEKPGPRPDSGHFALHVEDFGAVYRFGVETGSLSRGSHGHAVYVLPGGEAQMYLRDPSGNMVEVDHHDAGRWRAEIPEMVDLADIYPQAEGADEATLFLFLQPGEGARR